MSDSKYAPGVFVKGDSERVANSRSDAVALVFDGYKRKSDAPEVETVDEPADTEQPEAVKPGKPFSIFDDKD